MTSNIAPADASGSERLAALDRWSRPGVAGGQRARSFEQLLLEAVNRQAVGQTPATAAGQPAEEWTRPKGALGMGALPGAPSQALLSNDAPLANQPATTSGVARAAAERLTRSGTTPTSSSAGQAVVEAGKEHLGVPYLWGGTDPHHGFDCSGLVQDAYRAIGVEMPKWSRHQATMGVEVPSIAEALPGDVLAFGEPVNHVALYVGDGKMLHAPRTGEVVKIGAIDRPIATIRRIVKPGEGQPAAATGSVAPTTSTHSPGAAERLYQPLFEAAGERWNVDPALLAAVAKTESAFNPNAVSHVGAQGLMQFMPATAAEMGVDALDPASAVDGAARYLRKSLDQFGSSELAIASYNAGRGAVSRYGGIPPYPETQNYVEKVLDAWRSRS